ncbi:serine hydrolase FSH [Biscogniauxia marginata]|nr:serine hydrolase FSH [Biscogniauxia marginata]
MRILCFHGRGSNIQIFQAQTAAIRADLDDFDFDFVQGTVRHTEGNWSLYTTSFTDQPLYGYYNPISPPSILQTEEELFEIIERDGPFDGVLGFSGGAGLAAQLIVRDLFKHPEKQPSERPFRFAIFFNGTTPFNIFRVDEADVLPEREPAHDMIAEAHKVLMRSSAVRKKEEISDEDRQGHDTMLSLIDKFETRTLRTGQSFISDGTYGIYRYSVADNNGEPLIRIPTLHVRDPGEDEDDVNHGLNLLKICDPAFVREFNHTYGHDFPRGRREIKAISQLIRDTAQDSLYI